MTISGHARVVAHVIVAALVGLTALEAQGQAAGSTPALSATERRIDKAEQRVKRLQARHDRLRAKA